MRKDSWWMYVLVFVFWIGLFYVGYKYVKADVDAVYTMPYYMQQEADWSF